MKNVLIKTFDNGTSKRLIEIIYSIAAVKIYFTPSSEWGEGLLIMESCLPKTFSSILLTANLSFEELGQWRRQQIVVRTAPQLQIGFNMSWRLCLKSMISIET